MRRYILQLHGSEDSKERHSAVKFTIKVHGTSDSGSEFNSSLAKGKNDLLNASVEAITRRTLVDLNRRSDVRPSGAKREDRRSRGLSNKL